jgi:hypothetical protein
MDKTVLSFYIDDTNPYSAPAGAFETFLDFVQAEGIAGESSAILGWTWPEHGLLSQATSANEHAYIRQLQRAYSCGIDTHFELMTHNGRFDFDRQREPEDAIHEGLWLYEPEVSVEEYAAYFGSILDEGEKIGVRFTGMTWPGCGCPACNQRYAALRAAGIDEPNPQVWQALLRLAKAGRFRSSSVPCFFGGALDVASARCVARDGQAAVYQLPPNADDRMALWLNEARFADVDYYIHADGQAGRLVELVRAGAPYALFFGHWQGVNPANGLGWPVFTKLVARVQRHLKDQVVWMRPSDYTHTLV